MSETGSIKFKCEQIPAKVLRFAGFDELKRYRRELLDRGMMGVDENGIGFGNLSIRDGVTTQFYITGSGTAGVERFTPAGCAKVVGYDFVSNRLTCEGAVAASSESLTHAAVYESDPSARAIIHCHEPKLWSALRDKVPTTPNGVEYGTSEMAYAVKHLFDVTDLKQRKIFAMRSHAGGLVAFGRDLAEAFNILMRFAD